MFLKSKGILLAEFSLCWKPYHMNMSRFAKGQFQWWKKPIYYRPVVSPLERGPDFTYLDGRKPTITSLSELKRRQHHVELGKKIVQYLYELEEAKAMYQEEITKETLEQKRIKDRTLKAKGDQEIF